MRAAFAILLIAAAALSAARAQSEFFPVLFCATDTGMAPLLTPPYTRLHLGAAH